MTVSEFKTFVYLEKMVHILYTTTLMISSCLFHKSKKL